MQLSQPQEGSSSPQPVDETQLYFQAVGGEKKKRVYGIGSSKASYYPGSSSNTSSSSFTRNAEMELQIRQLQDKLQQMEQLQEDERMAREERDEAERIARAEQMRNEVQRLFQEQMDEFRRYMPHFPGNNNGSGGQNNDDTDNS